MRVYFDNAATTPVDSEVLKEILPYFSKEFGNPGSIHFMGRKAQEALDFSRKKIADYFGIDFENVVFTSSATEANNFIIRGLIRKFEFDNKAQKFDEKIPHIIVSKIEHESILETCRDLEKTNKVSVTYLDVDKNGIVDLKQLKNSLKKETILVSIMNVNNETGVIEPIKEISRIIKEFKESKLQTKNQSKYNLNDLKYPVFHTDAVQALNVLKEIKLIDLGVDFMTISGHKSYAPKGIAALLVDSNLRDFKQELIMPIITGGGQEFGWRASTENVSGIIGLAKAIELIEISQAKENIKFQNFKKTLEEGILKIYPKAVINSPLNSIGSILNVSFPNFTSEELIYKFDKQEIAISAGSACSAKALKPSYVLQAMNLTDKIINSAIRISFGKQNSISEINYFLTKLPEILNKN
jgi:cysteine desulfurase